MRERVWLRWYPHWGVRQGRGGLWTSKACMVGYRNLVDIWLVTTTIPGTRIILHAKIETEEYGNKFRKFGEFEQFSKFFFDFRFTISILFGHALSDATSKYHVRTAVHSTQTTASTATQSHRSPVHSQQANHNKSLDILGLLFPDHWAIAKRIRGQFSRMPSRMRLEVRSQYNLKFDPGASTLGAPPPPWEAQWPPGVGMSSCMPTYCSGGFVLPSATKVVGTCT